MNNLEKWIPSDIIQKYECLNYNHAAEILSESFPEEHTEIIADDFKGRYSCLWRKRISHSAKIFGNVGTKWMERNPDFR